MRLVATGTERELLASQQREIVFCDLRGFAAFAHAAPSSEIVDVLGAHHRAVGSLIVEMSVYSLRAIRAGAHRQRH